MHPRIQQVLAHLDSTRASLQQAVNDIPEKLRDQRPATDRWSPAEILQHLAMVEGRLTGMLKGKLDEARAAGLSSDANTTPVVPTFDLEGLKDRRTTIVAREGSIPDVGVSTAKALNDLSATRAALRTMVVSADGEDLSSIVAPHGRFGPINMYEWLLFIGGHEARHTEQVREAGRMLA